MKLGYEMVIGLETHVELHTRSKIFCSCLNAFGAEPNTYVCPVCMGLPGALPVFNEQVLRYAAMAGMALNCHVHHRSRFDRKNYFYPDLPKAYQISQFYRPLCENGFLIVQTSGGEKRIGITRIHMEEDAGKLLHDEKNGTALDMNRCGVPLIEIVSEPDIRSAEEAVCYLRKLRAILTYTGVSDCKMNEGSLRCDVNLSIHKPGEPFGTRTEMKNLNSFQSVEKAIEAEFERQVAAVEAGETVVQETRRFDQKSGKTTSMRRKENSADYRYFPDPDLPEIYLTDEDMTALREKIPPLPDERRERYMKEYSVSAYAAELLTAERWLADYFERGAAKAESPVALANLILGEVFAQLTARDTQHTGERDESSLPISPEHLAKLSDLMNSGKVNSSTGKKILGALFQEDCDPERYAQEHELFTVSDDRVLNAAVEKVLAANPDMVVSYKAGKLTVEKALMGKAMAETKGKADPERLRRLLLDSIARL
ncbi:MAG: Asp-tRNA(Asn)/Glu-tRNA(Gln) amidotransferase subunit GatB [Eubacteriales bacterium]|nr:Asp-tRNA(Asn)/Glu-tRNA(Gln) amidotransferase subunit GatB [Eubacteriales bacterium]